VRLKKIIEKPIKKDELERIKWLQQGLIALDEKARKAALERDLEFMEKKGKFMTPEEFHSILFSRKVKKQLIPKDYKREIERYHDMLVSNIAEILDIEELKDAEIGRMLGIPAAKEGLFELKKKGKVIGFVHFDEKKKKIDFIERIDDLPKEFKKRLKRK